MNVNFVLSLVGLIVGLAALLTLAVFPEWWQAQVRVLLDPSQSAPLTHLSDARAQTLPPHPNWRVVLRPALVLTLALGLAVSLTLGVMYVDRQHLTNSGALLLWAVTSAVVVLVALAHSGHPPSLRRDGHWLLVAALVLVAFWLRAFGLDHIPGDLHTDEVGTARFVKEQIYSSQGLLISPFRVGVAAQPTLYHYLIWGSMQVLGETYFAIRLPSAIVGALGVAAVYALVAVFDDRQTALFAAVLMVTYHYHQHWSRIALNNIWDVLWVPAMLAAFWWGWTRRWVGGAVLAGVAAGLAQYFYHGSKVGVLLLVGLWVWMWQRDEDRETLLLHAGLVTAVAVVVGAPITALALLDPQAYFWRAADVFAWTPEEMALVQAPSWQAYAWQQLWKNVGSILFVPEVTGFYNPRTPFLFGGGAVLFVVGLAQALVRFRARLPSNGVIFGWLGLTILFGGILLNGAPSSSHYVVIIPVLIWLVARGLRAVALIGFPWVAWGLAAVILLTDVYFYFGIYMVQQPGTFDNPWPMIP